jgi:vancomycin resistance protein VanJ
MRTEKSAEEQLVNPPNTQQSSPPVSRLRRRCLQVLKVISVMYLIVVMGCWLMLQWADLWWPATILMFAPRWVLALPLCLLLPIAGFLRSRSVVIFLVAGLIIGWPFMGFKIPWHRLTSNNPTGTSVRVMTVNMHYSKADPNSLEDLIFSSDSDIVAIQEWQGYEKSVLRFDPAWHVHNSLGQFLASRYPIQKVVQLGEDSTGKHASTIHYELDTTVGVVHLFSTHLASTRDSIYNTLHENPKGPTEVRANSILRRAQSEFVAGKASECKGPVLIVGDFNTPSESTIFADVWNGYTDAFSAAGWGWGYTFIGAKTTVRIDHILARNGWTCTKCRVGPFVGSPHRPVIADLVWKGENPTN